MDARRNQLQDRRRVVRTRFHPGLILHNCTVRRSLTSDRGREMAKHEDFRIATDVQVYF